MAFDELKSGFSYTGMEEEILKYWDESDIFHKGLELRANSERFSFYEGPPTANGRPGIHHVITRSIKDLVCRYKQMRGYLVDRKAGWDTHGLPVEIEVEKKLGLKTKADIEEHGIGDFNRHCRTSVFKYLEDWDAITHRIGYWLDLDKPYVTCSNDYIETVWWILANFFNRGLIYRGHKILPYCPRCGTGLSSHEVAQGYQDVKDPSIFIKVELVDEPGTKLLVWTTTPWTLISNVALAVAPEAHYVKVQHGEEKLILAEALAESVLEGKFEVLDRFKGAELEHKKYKPLFDYYQGKYDKIWFVTVADFVTLDDGSGIVHMAPAFGADDYSVGQRYGLPVVQAVDVDGTFKEEVTDFAGKFIKDADPLIIANLEERGILYKKKTYVHSYPHCWRCKSPLIYYARKSWYVRTSQFKEQLLKNNEQVNWVPPEIGSGRMGEWLSNNVDWALSRERYWGTPLNIWLCDSCDKMKAVDSIAMLRDEGIDVPDELDLHKPLVDDIKLRCECGGTMTRTPEVIDCWFDSGSMPYAQFHYPFENKEMFEQGFPCDFISEATDQTRGWFYSLLAISTLLFDKPAYKNVVVIEFLLDKKGKKMSKSTGNIVNPFDIVTRYGADAVRWYLLAVSQPHQTKRFDTTLIVEIQRRFLDTLKNTYSFFSIYANIDNVHEEAQRSHAGDVGACLESKAGDPVEIDLWLQSRLESLKRDVTTTFDSYDLTRGVRLISDFVVDELSNWYVRRCRRRFWASGDNSDKYRAFLELHTALVTCSLLAAPVIPFVTEKIHRELTGKESVHLEDFPTYNETKISKSLEERMDAAIKLVGLGRSARNSVQIKVRQPLAEMKVHLPEHVDQNNVAPLLDVIAEEINVKQVSFIADTTKVAEYQIVPNFKVLGPKVGAAMKAVKQALENLSEAEIKKFLDSKELDLTANGSKFHLNKDDLDVRLTGREGFAVAADSGFTVALSTVIDDDLRAEGFARELVNKIQNMRKEAEFNVTDRISVYLDSTEPVVSASGAHQNHIMKETLADLLEIGGTDGGFVREWDINGEKATITIIRK